MTVRLLERTMYFLALLVGLSLLYGCGAPGGGKSSASSHFAPFSIEIAPAAAEVRTGSPVLFSATISSSSELRSTDNASISRTSSVSGLGQGGKSSQKPSQAGVATNLVSWSINGLLGGSSDLGTISAAGLYDPPLVVPNPNTVEVTATSLKEPSVIQTALLTLYNPVPSLTSVTPSEVLLGAFSLRVRGLGFVKGSRVLVAGTPLPTTFNSSTLLTATGVAGQPGTAQVLVRNPEPGSVISAAAVTVQIRSKPVVGLPTSSPIAATANVYYSVGQSTSKHLETGSPTFTVTSGIAFFSTAQTGNIGVGDQVNYGTSSVAYIASKRNSNDREWTLVTARGAIPADVTNATVKSINRAYSSLSAALNGATDANHIGISDLASANVVLNIPCYYDSGPDTAPVIIANSNITNSSNYINVYTPNNTSTQANYSQRHGGAWTTNAYNLVVTNGGSGIDIRTNYVRVVGLQILMVEGAASTQKNPRGIRMDDLPASVTTNTSKIILDSNIIHYQDANTPDGAVGIGNADNLGARPTVTILNNIVYDVRGVNAAGIYVAGGNYYVYNNTVYNTYQAYESQVNSATTVFYKNDIAQQDTVGYGGTAVVSELSTNNLSDRGDAPGTNPENFKCVNFLNTPTRDLHLAPFNPNTVDQGRNLSADANYAFNYDVNGRARPYGSGWDIGADEYTGTTRAYAPPTITSFVMPSTASSVIVSVASLVASMGANPVAAYLITESSAVPLSTSPNWSILPPGTFTFEGTGTRTAYAWAMDAYGNISACATETVTITAALAASSSSPSAPETLFSMNWNSFISQNDWPTVPFWGLRLWDNNVSWQEVETSNGTYTWSNLDKWLTAAAAHGTDVLYTFGRTPQWASSNPNQACAYGNNGCAAPPSDVDSGDTIWKAFVTALVERSLASRTGHIKYYELWNEPDSSGTWTGTPAQMVIIARDAYTVIHSLDPNALVIGPGLSSVGALDWLRNYYAAGGSVAQDIVGYHAYVNTSDPSVVLNLTDSIRTIMGSYGISSKPLWFTEGSWGQNSTLTEKQQAAYLAQEYIYLWSKNVARYYWYSWDNAAWGTMWDSRAGIHPAGTAYGLLHSWLAGSKHATSPCYQTADATWWCSLTLVNDIPAEIVWNSRKTVSKGVSPALTNYRTLANGMENSIVGNNISVGDEPILLTAERP